MPDDEISQPRNIRRVCHARVARPLATCVASVVASFVAALLWTTPSAAPYVPEATVHEMLPGERVTGGLAERILGTLRSPEHLATVLRTIGAAPRGEFDATARDQLVNRVRDRLRITTEAAPSGRERVVAIRYVGSESCTWPTMLVNTLADEYVGAIRSDLEALAQRDLDLARSALMRAQRDAESARESLDTWLEAQLAAMNDAHANDQAVRDVVAEDNWKSMPGEDLEHELEQLYDRREALLRRMTIEHPDVRALDLEIADCRHELEAIVVPTRNGPSETLDQELHSMTGGSSVDRDTSDAQRRILRQAVADAVSRHAELAAAEVRAVENLAATRKAKIAKITPALGIEPTAARTGWKNMLVVILFGLLAALTVNGAWPASLPAAEPRATIENIAEFETEFGLPVLGMISLGSI